MQRQSAQPRILVIVSNVYADGGIQRFNRTFVSACDRLGLRCDVLSLRDSEESRARWQPPQSANVELFGHDKARFALAVAAKILRGGYDFIVVGHINLLTLVAGITKLRKSARVILIAHGIEVWSGIAGLRRRALRAVDLVLCVSRYTRETMQQQAPELADARFSIFPNALSESWTEQFATVGFSRPKSLPPRYLLSVTRLDQADRYKGIIAVLETLGMLEDSTLHYVIAGIGDDMQFLKQAAERCNVAHRVHFTGRVSDAELASLYRFCVAFVLPSGKEGFGIVYLEAMYFGACVIAAREKGVVDVVRHNETGLLISYGDTVALKQSIDRLAADAALRERLRAAGAAMVVGNGEFTFAAYVARLAGVLQVPAARPKVVFVNRYFHPDESATSRMLSDLAFRLAAAGVSVSVVTSRQLYDDPHALLPARELVGGVAVHRVPTSTQGRAHLLGRAFDYLSFHFSAGIKLFGLVRRGDLVVAKTDPPLISVVAAQVAALRRARLVNWLQDVFPEVASALGMRVTRGWLASLTIAARNQSLRYASANVVLGERMRDYVRSLGVAAERIRVVPNWADTEEIAPRPPGQSALRAKLRLRDRFVIGYFGNLGRAHEFQTLLGAARLLRADPRFAFLINGGGAKVEELRRAVESEALQGFHFQSYQPRELLADSLAAADVHLISLLPALEGLIVPSKLYGILAAGRPAVFIGDPRGEVARILREHDCGVVKDIGASEALAAELRLLCAAPQRVAAMGQKARDLAVARYGSRQAAAHWLELLQDIVKDVRKRDVAPPSSGVLTILKNSK